MNSKLVGGGFYSVFEKQYSAFIVKLKLRFSAGLALSVFVFFPLQLLENIKRVV